MYNLWDGQTYQLVIQYSILSGMFLVQTISENVASLAGFNIVGNFFQINLSIRTKWDKVKSSSSSSGSHESSTSMVIKVIATVLWQSFKTKGATSSSSCSSPTSSEILIYRFRIRHLLYHYPSFLNQQIIMMNLVET